MLGAPRAPQQYNLPQAAQSDAAPQGSTRRLPQAARRLPTVPPIHTGTHTRGVRCKARLVWSRFVHCTGSCSIALSPQQSRALQMAPLQDFDRPHAGPYNRRGSSTCQHPALRLSAGVTPRVGCTSRSARKLLTVSRKYSRKPVTVEIPRLALIRRCPSARGTSTGCRCVCAPPPRCRLLCLDQGRQKSSFLPCLLCDMLATYLKSRDFSSLSLVHGS